MSQDHNKYTELAVHVARRAFEKAKSMPGFTDDYLKAAAKEVADESIKENSKLPPRLARDVSWEAFQKAKSLDMQSADIEAEARAVARAVLDQREEKKTDDQGKLMQHRSWDFLFIVSEFIMMILYALGTKYHYGALGKQADPSLLGAHNFHATKEVAVSFAMWVDVHTMIFIGFGFLMVFLKAHSWSSVGFNYLIAAWTIQCGVLLGSFFRKALVDGFSEKIELSLEALLEGDFCAAACLITMGALLGKTTFTQLFFLVTCESVWYSVNMVLVLNILKCHDVGGAMTIHMFGAYFGLAATYFF